MGTKEQQKTNVPQQPVVEQPAEPQLNLNGAQIKQLEAMIQEMPTKYGLPLLNFLNAVIQENTKAAEKK